MKKIDIFSKRNVATETFNEVSRIIESHDFEKQIRDFVKSMKIREVFLMKSEVIGVESIELASKEKVFSENSWLNLVNFLKTQLNLYENSENKNLVQDYITETIDSHCYSIFGDNNISSKSKNVDDLNYFLTDLKGVTFSYDIDKKTILMFVSETGEYITKEKYFYQFGYYVDNEIQINTNLLKIFSFDYFWNFRDLYKNLDNEFNFKFLKYAVGLEDESWLSSFIVSETRNNFENIISSWIEESLKFNSKVFHLELFPYNFYKDGTLVLEPNFESEYEITDYFSKKNYNDNVEINSLFLLSFSDLKSIESIAKNIDKRIVRAYLKYVSEIISAEEFASEVIKEIESRLDKIKEGIFDKMLGLTIPRFDLHPVSIYSEEELENFFIKNKENFRSFIESRFFEKVLSGDKDKNYFYDFLKSKLTIEDLSEELLLEVISIENCSLYIEGYSDLNTEDKREYVFKLLKEYSPENPQYYDHHILKNVYDCQVFDFIKNTYKYYLNKFISGDSIKEEEFLGVMISNNQNNKFVLFKDDYFSKPYLYLSEEQISELKSELIPLLEEIQDKIYIKCYTDKGIPFNLSMSMKEIFDVLDIKNIHIFGSLFKTIDWYPKKIVLVSDFSHPDDFVSAVERFSFIRKLSESEEFDISAILISELEWGYNHGKPMSDNNGTEWVYKRHQQLSGMIKHKISNGYLFSKSCTENFEEKQKFLDVVLSYNTRMPIYKIEVEE